MGYVDGGVVTPLKPTFADKSADIGQKVWTGIKVVGTLGVIGFAILQIKGCDDDRLRDVIKTSKTRVLLRLLQDGPPTQNIINDVENTCHSLGGTCVDQTFDQKTGILTVRATTESLGKNLSKIIDKSCPKFDNDGNEICLGSLNNLYDALPPEPVLQQVQKLEQ